MTYESTGEFRRVTSGEYFLTNSGPDNHVWKYEHKVKQLKKGQTCFTPRIIMRPVEKAKKTVGFEVIIPDLLYDWVAQAWVDEINSHHSTVQPIIRKVYA